MFKQKLLIGTFASIVACSSFADNSAISYTHVDFGYQTGEALEEDFSGFGVAGRAALNESFFLVGGYSSISSDEKFNFGGGFDEVDLNAFNIGIGFHAPINNNMDFVTSIAYADSEIETAGFSVDGNGYVIGAGLRGKPTDSLEFSAFINYAEIEDEGETGYSVGARYSITPIASLGLAYSTADDVDAVTFSVRFDL